MSKTNQKLNVNATVQWIALTTKLLSLYTINNTKDNVYCVHTSHSSEVTQLLN